MNELIKSIIDLISSIEPWWTIILIPIWQEVLFRYLPFRFFYLQTGKFWLIGIVSSLLFASIHFYFGKWFVLYAFLGGIVLWWIMVNYGLIAVVLAHAFVNIIDLLFGLRKFLIK